MKALYSFGTEVSTSRVMADHRRWILPVGLVLAINLAVLVMAVLPLRQSAASASTRAEASAQTLRLALQELKNAEATRDGQTQAAKDLERFYAEVLPSDLTAARRITRVRFTEMARSHDVAFESGVASPETVRDSTLERLHVTYALSGNWDDIRQLIYEIETGPDFIVIDNVQLEEGRLANAQLSLTLELSTYYKAPGAAGASVSVAGAGVSPSGTQATAGGDGR
jgi:Tfp pilus assembly protein PilO